MSTINNSIKLICPTHKCLLSLDGDLLSCLEGCKFPIEGGIPRFVPRENYASSFGLQWNRYRKTQLDSYTGLTISKDRLQRLVGGDLSVVKGKRVLEAGCGAGRFSEILLQYGADLSAVDISSAVEANFKNCCHFANYQVYQASILDLPFQSGQFDIVICVGVIQHTPNPEETMRALCAQLKPGGFLVIDHYTYGYPETKTRKIIRTYLLQQSSKFSLHFCKTISFVLWPIHSLLWKLRNIPGFTGIRNSFLNFSPMVDYHEAYPQLGPKLLRIWATLDMHDTLTDRYKHLRSTDEIRNHLAALNLIDMTVLYGGNGVEARAFKQPLQPLRALESNT